MSVVGHQSKACYISKKVGTPAVETAMSLAYPTKSKPSSVAGCIDIQGKDITPMPLLTPVKIADYVVGHRNAHLPLHRPKQPAVFFKTLALFSEDRQAPDFVHTDTPDHAASNPFIWITLALNAI